jgi:membrane protein involved in D-alanine export
VTGGVAIAVLLVAYVLATRGCNYIQRPALRSWAFVATNLGAFIGLAALFSGSETRLVFVLCGVYVLLIVISFVVMAAVATRLDWLAWLAFAFPLLPLILMKYMPPVWNGILVRAHVPKPVVAVTFIGLSYMAFRLSHLVLEVRNGVVPRPSLPEYLGFAFFLPTMLVGPINPYSVHQRSFTKRDPSAMPLRRCLLRILVGGVKYEFLGNVANQISFAGLFMDGKPHGGIDIPVAMVAYYLYLYWNFSGFCDIAIGVAGLTGIQVKDNFNNPFAARNIKEYWNRWHITLSEYVRDVIFSPVSKTLTRKFGTSHVNLAVSAGILAAFFIVGLWHGSELHFILWGLLQGAALVVNHNYTVWLKRRLGPQKYRIYNENRWVNLGGQVLTFCFQAAVVFVFANDNYLMGVVVRSVFGFSMRRG